MPAGGKFVRRGCNPSVCCSDSGLFHEELNLIDRSVARDSLREIVQRLIITPDDLLTGGFFAYFVINDAVSGHINAHICGRLIGVGMEELLKDRGENREYLNIAVIIHGGPAICLQMERVDHVHIIQICRGRFISQIHRMLERKVPDGEGLELGIARVNSARVFVIQLGEAGRHLAASGTGSRYDNQGPGRFDIIILAVSVFA